ncbi:calcium-transporting ATPase 2, plasma membrane-type-like isoform X2 [Vitis riparia]|uniref:calcium-transporting ATPase 2, plasma membrane-type-like isoform X2 n=1 Tax=Vitis riparia TaxID=96939 RepID=UPI00155A85F6|nr:calcium-transporting ATPase 2, plasma membrane-type-like isoform X2 [Vitis riparia]
MESYLDENFSGVKPKHSSDVKNPKRRFRFSANLSKRVEPAAMRRTIQEKLRIAVLVSKAAFLFIQGVPVSDYVVPEEIKAAGFQICADELGSIVEGHDQRDPPQRRARARTPIELQLFPERPSKMARQEEAPPASSPPQANIISPIQGNDAQNSSRQVRNGLYDPSYDAIGLPIDPHLRLFALQKKNRKS